MIRQHQFAALCRERGWTYRLQGAFDSANTPSLELPRFGLRAELWVDAPHGEENTAASGIYLYLSTDQVRFTQADGRPRPLSEVPALLFSEVMRDVDLFVGVCSIGADPTWQDGGARGFDGYWASYAFGDLGESARTRRAVLEGLLPMLKIRERCTLEDRFLVVRGDLGTYKIHLGSGNILREPGSRYLCIVPARGKDPTERLRLPFEGDHLLAVVLSKAFLLAEDRSIKDPTIARQLQG